MPAPMIDELELKAVQIVRTEVEQGYRRHRVAGLDGVVHQHLGRRSHRVLVAGLLLGDTAVDDLATLQAKAAAGDEVGFTADIATALEIDRMVIESFAAEQGVGGGQTAYAMMLAESPPLPPPAEVSAFGGLGDFGVGDLGFDPGALGDVVGAIAEGADAVMGAVDAAISAVEQLEALANLADLGSLGNPVKPVTDALQPLGALGGVLQGITDAAARLAN